MKTQKNEMIKSEYLNQLEKLIDNFLDQNKVQHGMREPYGLFEISIEIKMHFNRETYTIHKNKDL